MLREKSTRKKSGRKQIGLQKKGGRGIYQPGHEGFFYAGDRQCPLEGNKVVETAEKQGESYQGKNGGYGKGIVKGNCTALRCLTIFAGRGDGRGCVG